MGCKMDEKPIMEEEAKYEQELQSCRERLRAMRDQMVQRTVQRMNNRPGGLRPRPDQYPLVDDSKWAWEVAKLLAQTLLDRTTMLPVDVDTIHKRVGALCCAGCMQALRQHHVYACVPSRPAPGAMCALSMFVCAHLASLAPPSRHTPTPTLMLMLVHRARASSTCPCTPSSSACHGAWALGPRCCSQTTVSTLLFFQDPLSWLRENHPLPIPIERKSWLTPGKNTCMSRRVCGPSTQVQPSVRT